MAVRRGYLEFVIGEKFSSQSASRLKRTSDRGKPLQLTVATRKNLSFIVVVLFLFLFRIGFGLCSEFWFEDERQVYLIGLKHFTTHAWPYFGPDVTNQIQI